MAAIIPQVITEDRAGGAQIIDGSLRFDSRKSQRLTRTPSSAGNRKTWTWSAWVKTVPGAFSASNHKNLFSVDGGSSDATRMHMFIGNASDKIQHDLNASSPRVSSSVYRDVSGWYHIVVKFDSTQSTARNQIAWYINGQQIVNWDTESTITQNNDFGINGAYLHAIGSNLAAGPGQFFDGLMSQVYLIDGQALDPSYFGFTDPLTNTWRPKKYVRTTTITGDTGGAVGFGTNGFYLPFDGNSPIGQDMSGKGNNWTPVNFGGSNTIEKATGALPILNTDGGGKVARVGVRTDSNASSLVLALPLVGIKSDFSNAINSGTSNKAITASGAAADSTSFNFYGGGFNFDGTDDLLSTPSSSDFDFGTGDYTAEGWVYITSTSDEYLMNMGTTVGLHWGLNFYSTNLIRAGRTDGGGTFKHEVTYNFTANRWYHIAISRQSGTSRLFLDGVLIDSKADTDNIAPNGTLYFGRYYLGTHFLNGYLQDLRIYKGVAKYTQNFIPASTDPDILPDTPSGAAYSSNVALVPSTDGAVAFQGTSGPAAATNYLNAGTSGDFTVGTSGNFTFEAFINPTSVSDTSVFSIGASTIFTYRIISGSPYLYVQTTGGILNTGTIAANKWTHIAVTRNSGTLYSFIDGVLVGSVANTGSFDAATGTGAGTFIGAANITAVSPPNYSFTGQISNLHWVNGTALYTSNFTPPTAPISSVANTKLLCCKSNSSATAFDVSPGAITANGNAAATNFNPFNVNINTQRGQESGYCTLNPLRKSTGSSEPTLSEGNLTITSGGAGWCNGGATIDITSGKWYWEVYPRTVGGSGLTVGIASEGYEWNRDTTATGLPWLGSQTGTSWSVYSTGQKYFGASGTNYMNAFTSSDTVGVAFDMDAQTLTYYLNGVSQGVAFSGVNAGGKSIQIGISVHGTGSNKASANFGQKPFSYAPPAGFQPLALANTPRPTIVRPDQYVGVSTFTGTGGTQNIITGFKPDLVWVKGRNAADNHSIFDSVRGVGNYLASNSTGTEGNSASSLTSFNRDGFTSGGSVIGGNGTTYVAWAWKAGGQIGVGRSFMINDVGYATASAAGLTAGTITPTGVSVNTKSGFSIVTWTGNGVSSATIPHGLNNSPAFIITVSRDGGSNWNIYHQSLATNNRLFFTTSAAVNVATSFSSGGIGSGTSSLINFTQGTNNVDNANANNVRYVAYLWAEIPGFSKFGSYTGTGVAGNFVYTGFRPKWIMIKNYSGGSISNWALVDSTRSFANVANHTLAANLSNAESHFGGGESVFGSGNKIDLVSNGFVLREGNAWGNETSTSYIYAAYAEAPAQNLFGGQSNAR